MLILPSYTLLSPSANADDKCLAIISGIIDLSIFSPLNDIFAGSELRPRFLNLRNLYSSTRLPFDFLIWSLMNCVFNLLKIATFFRCSLLDSAWLQHLRAVFHSSWAKLYSLSFLSQGCVVNRLFSF